MSLIEKYGAEIESIVARYPHKRSAVLPLLFIAQDEYGYLTDAAMREVADLLDLPPTDVFEVAGFYSLLYEQPVGAWLLQVCDDVPCAFCGAEDLIAALQEKLGIAVDQTTPDGMFTLQRVKCLADCDHAPVLQANLEYYHDLTTPEKVEAVLAELRRRAESGEKLSISGRYADR
ncbi:complex I 24 kDa subunit family protein [Roseiflexus sp.]|uniref:complex I 24 kDa subunit family protein n=1 Tax=Roseiflexus sp. TaxID=2562120 RepID=UPI00398A6EFD